LLVGALNKYVEEKGEPKTFTVVQSYQANSHEDILQQHDFFVANRFEGIMIRQYASVMDIETSRYRSSRSNNLMKYKLFIDEECIVVGGVECVGTEVGAIKFLVRDPRGNEFYIRPSGRIEKRVEWWDAYKVNPSKFVGKLYTIRYQQLSADNIPRFPTGVGFRKDL
jgi:DNA ligase-1